MLYQQIIFYFILAIFINTLLNLRALRKPKKDCHLPDPAPLISILVPARNEEANIGDCIRSLQHQDYPNFEVIVLDDSSCDQTLNIVAEIAKKDSRVRLIKGEPLPPEWAGKPFACHQLAQQAKGSWFLFADADTVLSPSALHQVLCTAIDSNAALISGFPHQQHSSIWQKMAMPVFFYFLLICSIPLWLIQRLPNGSYPIAVGQFMFFSAREYWSIGGHESVRTRVIEDVALGKEIAANKYKHVTLDLSSLVSCRMYQDFGTMWDGVGRWLVPVASASFVGLLAAILAVFFIFLAPFLWLAYGLLIANPTFFWHLVVLLQVLVILVTRYIAGRRFSQPFICTFLHPLGICFMLIAGVYAYYRYINGDHISWKERIYNVRSQIP